MLYSYILFLLLLLYIQENPQIIDNPRFLNNKPYPFVLSSNNDYYYVVTSGEILTIEKESGNIIVRKNEITYTENFKNIADGSYNNYIYDSNIYVKIVYEPYIYYHMNIIRDQMTNVGSIAKDNDFIIYGYNSNQHLSFKNGTNTCFSSENINLIDSKLSCKFIKNEEYLCAIINNNNNKLNLVFLIYHIDIGNTDVDNLDSLNSIDIFGSYLSLGLYDTDINNIKILCKHHINKTVEFQFFNISMKDVCHRDITFLGESLIYYSDYFEEKNCYSSVFNSEYLFCCATQDNIICFRINTITYNLNKIFIISKSGLNLHLNIKSNNNFFVLFFMNNNGPETYEYYIYNPICENKNYTLINSLNENRPEEDFEKLSNLIIVKTNKYYLKFGNIPNNFGYFTLNKEIINNKILIENNSYILDFIVENRELIYDSKIIINYIVSVEEDEAYTKECTIQLNLDINNFNKSETETNLNLNTEIEITCDISCLSCNNKLGENNTNCFECNIEKGYYPLYDNYSFCYSNETIKKGYYLNKENNPFTWEKCYEKCESCNSGGNDTNMNCLSCKTNSDNNFILLNGNCIKKCLINEFITPNGECLTFCPNGTYKYSYNNSCLESCPYNYEINEYNECILKVLDLTLSANEFKDQIMNDITSYVNSSKVFNGSNFLAVVLTSDNMDPEEQLKNGISAVDLGECTQIIKNYYNISNDEGLIILNMEYKNDDKEGNETINNNNEDKSFNLGKNTELEIFDMLGRKLDLSVCKEDIKIMKYIGDVEELDIQSAKDLSEQGIDVFNANDKFFNDICHPYENSDGKDIILSDRRSDIYQNATFCQDGCIYQGMNYDLMVANCICDSSSLILDNKNKTNNDENEKSQKVDFESITESFISNLLSFNYKVLKCWNLVFNLKILVKNIGFYCLFGMFILQIILFLIYLNKRLKPIKNFMLIFNNENQTNNDNITKKYIKSNPPPKNNNSIINPKDGNKKQHKKKKLKNNNDIINDSNSKKKIVEDYSFNLKIY